MPFRSIKRQLKKSGNIFARSKLSRFSFVDKRKCISYKFQTVAMLLLVLLLSNVPHTLFACHYFSKDFSLPVCAGVKLNEVRLNGFKTASTLCSLESFATSSRSASSSLKFCSAMISHSAYAFLTPRVRSNPSPFPSLTFISSFSRNLNSRNTRATIKAPFNGYLLHTTEVLEVEEAVLGQSSRPSLD